MRRSSTAALVRSKRSPDERSDIRDPPPPRIAPHVASLMRATALARDEPQIVGRAVVRFPGLALQQRVTAKTPNPRYALNRDVC